MPLPSWPTGLPDSPRHSSWGLESPFQNPDVSEMETGPERMRPAPDTGTAVLSYELLFTATEFLVFEDFVRNDLYGGSSRFLMRIIRPGSYSAEKTAWLEDGTYSATHEGPFMVVRFGLKVRDLYE